MLHCLWIGSYCLPEYFWSNIISTARSILNPIKMVRFLFSKKTKILEFMKGYKKFYFQHVSIWIILLCSFLYRNYPSSCQRKYSNECTNMMQVSEIRLLQQISISYIEFYFPQVEIRFEFNQIIILFSRSVFLSSFRLFYPSAVVHCDVMNTHWKTAAKIVTNCNRHIINLWNTLPKTHYSINWIYFKAIVAFEFLLLSDSVLSLYSISNRINIWLSKLKEKKTISSVSAKKVCVNWMWCKISMQLYEYTNWKMI